MHADQTHSIDVRHDAYHFMSCHTCQTCPTWSHTSPLSHIDICRTHFLHVFDQTHLILRHAENSLNVPHQEIHPEAHMNASWPTVRQVHVTHVTHRHQHTCWMCLSQMAMCHVTHVTYVRYFRIRALYSCKRALYIPAKEPRTSVKEPNIPAKEPCVPAKETCRTGGFSRGIASSVIGVTWHIRMCNITHSCVWHDSYICATCLTRVCDMTHPYVRHDSFICVT